MEPIAEPAQTVTSPTTARAPSLVPWRLLALFYDFWPVLALWMLVSAGFTVAFYAAGHDSHQNIAPFSALQWGLWACCWIVAGLYATVSWRHGGQTLGMRPWRLHLQGIDGTSPGWGALWRRYAMGSVSLLAGGLGFWWAWVDRDRLTWHDRFSGTRLRRAPKRG